MKSFLRLVIALLVAVFAIGPVVAAYAQDAAKPCFSLAQADCDLLYGAFNADNSAKYQAGLTAAFDLNAVVSGKQGGTVKVNGTFDLGKADAANPVFALSVKANAAPAAGASGTPMDLTADVRGINKKIYLNIPMMTQGKWQYLETQEAAAMASGMSKNSMSSLPVNPNDPATKEQEAAILKAISAPDITTVAVKDATVGSVAVKQYDFTMDVIKLIQQPDLRPLIAKSAKQTNPKITDAEIDSKIQDLAKGLAGTTLAASVQVGSEDKLLHGFSMHLVLKVDPKVANMSSTSSSASAEPVDADITFNVTLDKIGTAATVEEPTGATKLDLSGMFGGMGAGAGSAGATTGSTTGGDLAATVTTP